MGKYHFCKETGEINEQGKPKYWIISPNKVLLAFLGIGATLFGAGFGYSSLLTSEREKLLNEKNALQEKIIQQSQDLQGVKDVLRLERGSTILEKRRVIRPDEEHPGKVDTVYYLFQNDLRKLEFLPPLVPYPTEVPKLISTPMLYRNI